MTLQANLRAIMPGLNYRARKTELFGDDWVESNGLYLPRAAAPPPKPTCVDLFCGAGGFSLGFHQAGHHVIGAADGDHAAAFVYLLNLGAPDTIVHVLPGFDGLSRPQAEWHGRYAGARMTAAEFFAAAAFGRKRQRPAGVPGAPGSGWISSHRDHERGVCAPHIDDPERRLQFCDTYHATPEHRSPCRHFWLGDIRELTGRMVNDALALGRDVDVVVGGPPCQGFSTVGKRPVLDPRNSLVFEFARLALEIRPRSMVMENVLFASEVSDVA